MTERTRLQAFGEDPATQRRLYLATAESADDLADLDLPESGFVCLLAWGAAGAPDDVVSRVAKRLPDAGARYVCAWGSDCERVHDLVDHGNAV